jgi:coatomer protein complex subunit gamma
MTDEGPENNDLARAGYAFLEGSLRHRSEMVIFEAAKAICYLPAVEASDLSPAISVLQMFLGSSKSVVRFGAMRILHRVALTKPMACVVCNDEMELLIGDTNRSIATLAITTLLKTGNESSVERLMKQISAFMADIADEFKITVVVSIQELCVKYPNKHRVLCSFLSNFLREEGGYQFKKSIVSAIIYLMRNIPETKENGLLHLCEFIEDCEFTALSTNILTVIGDEGPTTNNPSRYIRFIYNRVILENAQVRAAAVTALSKFGASVPSLRQSVITLLKRSLSDEDDEVRDRTGIVVDILKKAVEDHHYGVSSVAGGVSSSGDGAQENDIDNDNDEDKPDVPSADDSAAFLILENLHVTFNQLERSLMLYKNTPGAMDDGVPLSFNSLPVVEDVVEAAQNGVDDSNNNTNAIDGAGGMSDGGASSGGALSNGENGGDANPVVDPAAAVYAIPELASLGRTFRSTPAVPLTELETEYVVSCVKHIFEANVVLQFIIQNTIDDQKLTNVTIAIEGDNELFTVTGEIPCPEIKYGDKGSCFVVLERDQSFALMPSSFECEMHFGVVGVDPNSGEEEGDSFEEEYAIEALEISTSDFMAKVNLGVDFRRGWEGLGGNDAEVLEKYALQFKTLEAAVKATVDFFGMMPADGTGVVKVSNKPHMLHLTGMFVGNVPVFVRAQLVLDGGGVVLKVAVRSENPDVSRQVADCVR